MQSVTRETSCHLGAVAPIGRVHLVKGDDDATIEH